MRAIRKSQIPGPSDFQTLRLSDPQTFRPSDLQTLRPSDSQTNRKYYL